jgi:cell division protein FtsI/penicillin-binding protein 2
VLRRDAVSLLLAACAAAETTGTSLSRFFETEQGTALLVDVKTRRLIAGHGTRLAGGALVPPGSTIKPFVLAALLRRGKIGPEEGFVCPGRLSIGRHSFDCSHPRLGSALRVRTALAYSCNCFVAHFAERFESGELAAELARAGLGAITGLLTGEVSGRIQPAKGAEANRLQALGEERVLITAAELTMGYRWLALGAGRPEMQPIVEGLEDAVEYGTAQLARVESFTVAGKTGSVRTADGARVAWFAGFAPSRAAEVVVTVMLQGRSGGADAAPVAGKILAAYRAGRV